MNTRALWAAALTLALAGGAAAADLDTTPPTLTGFALGTSQIDVRGLARGVAMRLQVRDEQTGLWRMALELQGPSGQRIALGPWLSRSMMPAADAELGWTPNPRSEPGLWRVATLALHDANDNRRVYSGEELAAMGFATTLVVTNAHYDAAPPRLLRGEIRTPVLSRSAQQPGGRTRQSIAPALAALELADDGSPAVSGLADVSLTLCQQGAPAQRIELRSDGLLPPGQARFSGEVGGAVAAAAAGVYDLCVLAASDHSGNALMLVGPALGGTTDFRAHFPAGTTIEVQP